MINHGQRINCHTRGATTVLSTEIRKSACISIANIMRRTKEPHESEERGLQRSVCTSWIKSLEPHYPPL